MPASSRVRDYSLVGPDAKAAVEAGLVAAEWYRTGIARPAMKALMQRTDGPAIRDNLLWLGLLAGLGTGGFLLWGSWWALPFFIGYGVLYGSSGDSRWHECGHRTAFRTEWMNDAIYQIASFMMIREPTIWRWSHTRHHTDTIIVGRDPEIVATRPPKILEILVNIFALKSAPKALARVALHATGRLTEEEKTFVPEAEWPRVCKVARVWLAIHAAALALALGLQSWLPVLYVGILPTMYGGWLTPFFGLTQHAGLAENVLDYRLNTRTVMMNPVFRFLYLNMNYHIEHHMFPMVPYHRLPRLHEAIKADCPRPAASTIEAYAEIIPALLRQRRDPDWCVRRELPAGAAPFRHDLHGAGAMPAPAA